jgi:hypothetical protein
VSNSAPITLRGFFSVYGNVAVQSAKGKDVESSQFSFTAQQLSYITDNFIHLDHEELISASGGASYLWLGTRINLDMIFGTGLRDDLSLVAPSPALRAAVRCATRFYSSDCRKRFEQNGPRPIYRVKTRRRVASRARGDFIAAVFSLNLYLYNSECYKLNLRASRDRNRSHRWLRASRV